MKVKDRNGKEVTVGTILKTEMWREALPVQCIHMDKDEVHLRHERNDELPIKLTPKELRKSRWVVSGFKKIK